MSTINPSNGEPVIFDAASAALIAQRLGAASSGKLPAAASAGGDRGPAASAGNFIPLTTCTPRMITGSTSIGTDKWEYSLKRVGSGGTSHTGLIAYGDAVKGRNVWEGLTKAGYVAAVASLRPIPNGAVVMCFEGKTGSDLKLVFYERNEPVCE